MMRTFHILARTALMISNLGNDNLWKMFHTKLSYDSSVSGICFFDSALNTSEFFTK